MIYVRGNSTWHAVRPGSSLKTWCGLRRSWVIFADWSPEAVFLCRSCQAIIARSEVAA